MLAFGLGADCVDTRERGSDAVLDPSDLRCIESLGKAGEQVGQSPGKEAKHVSGGVDHQDVRTRRQHQKGDHEAGDTAERNLEHAIERRADRVGVGARRP